MRLCDVRFEHLPSKFAFSSLAGRSVTYCCMRYKSELFGSILLSCLRCLVLFNVHCRNCYLRMAVNCCDTWSRFGKLFLFGFCKNVGGKMRMRIVCVRFLIFIPFTATTQGGRMKKKRKTKTADSGTRSIWFWCISAVIFFIVIVLLSDLCGRVHLVWPKTCVCVCVFIWSVYICMWICYVDEWVKESKIEQA